MDRDYDQVLSVLTKLSAPLPLQYVSELVQWIILINSLIFGTIKEPLLLENHSLKKQPGVRIIVSLMKYGHSNSSILNPDINDHFDFWRK